MGVSSPELTEGMKAALALTAVGLADPLPAEEAVQCGAVLAIALARFCDPIRCQYDERFGETFTPALPPSWPRATAANSKNLLKGKVPQHVIDALDTATGRPRSRSAWSRPCRSSGFRSKSGTRGSPRSRRSC